MSKTKTVLQKGKLIPVPTDTKVDYHFPSTSDFFGNSLNLITGLTGVSSARTHLGSKATTQAISLVNREAPLVISTSQGNEAPIKKFGKWLSVIAEEDGVVKEVSPDHIKIGSKEYELYNYYNLGRKSYLTNYPKVKVGDKVKQGDIIATSNYSDDKGNLSLGSNLTTAILPHSSGLTFEDAYAVTQTGAKKLTSSEMFKYNLEEKFGVIVSKNRYIGLFPNKFFNTQLANIDDRGIVKVGTEVKYGDPLVLAFTPKALKSSDISFGKLSSVLKHAFNDQALIWDHEQPGEVIDAIKTGDLITVNIKTTRQLQPGDKIAVPFGNKGCVTIIPDAMAPHLKDGTVPDVLLNSMSITSRVAPALIMSLALGKLAKKLGHPVEMPQFQKESLVQSTIDTLKKHGISEVESVYNPLTGTHSDVTVGPLYFTRLGHSSEDKISSRSQGVSYDMFGAPSKTNKDESAKRIGGLGTTVLLSHGATQVLSDIAKIRSTKNDEYWRRLKMGLPLPSLPPPVIFDNFIAHLQGAGIKVNRNTQNTRFQVLPMTNKDVLSISNGAINEPLTFRVKENTLIPEPGGLFDPAKVGVLGDKYNHIDLNYAIPNPISEEYLRKLLGVTKDKYLSMIHDGTVLGELKKIDVTTEIKKYKDYLRSGKKTDRDNALKMLQFLGAMKEANINIPDLVLNKFPIIPSKFRPAVAQGDLTLSADANYLYKDLQLNNLQLKDTKDIPEDVVKKLRAQQYDAAKAIYGLGDPINTKNKEKGFKGLLASAIGLRGTSPKASLFQTKVVNHPLDLVGRGVALMDAGLHMDEISLPHDMIWSIYKPMIMRRLAIKGIPVTKATEYIESRNMLAQQALNEEMKTRPVSMTRDPQLHRFSHLAFWPKLNADPANNTISVNPLVAKGFTLDIDGDQVGVNLPVTEGARNEMVTKMLPSKNLIHHKTMQVINLPSNEAALGLFTLSKDNNKKTPKKFKSEQEVIQAYNRGEIGHDAQVEIA